MYDKKRLFISDICLSQKYNLKFFAKLKKVESSYIIILKQLTINKTSENGRSPAIRDRTPSRVESQSPRTCSWC